MPKKPVPSAVKPAPATTPQTDPCSSARSKWALGGQVTLPTYGFQVQSPTFIAFHATSWGGRRYESPVLFTVQLKGRGAHIFHGFGDAHITWHGRPLDVRREAELAL
jgi:hypothetical protein